MRIAVSLCALTLLAGCAVVPPPAWTFDPTRPQAGASLSKAEVLALTERTAQLQLERNAIRTRIASEPDARNRLPLYERLHRNDMALSPLERRLAAAGTAR